MKNPASLHVMQHLSKVVAVAGETVAVKSVDASNFRSIAQIDQIQDEISVLSGLKHPCIIRLLDMHFTNNIFYFVMEYASGGCLVDYVRKQVGRVWPRSMHCVAQKLLGISPGVSTHFCECLEQCLCSFGGYVFVSKNKYMAGLPTCLSAGGGQDLKCFVWLSIRCSCLGLFAAALQLLPTAAACLCLCCFRSVEHHSSR